jgi:class 3 adenylate cyclase
MNRLPGGTVTLLFTDIEGSTQLLHELGSGYREALEEHRRVIREAVQTHEGVEVDTQGDAFFVAFPSARAAVEAAERARVKLASGPIRVRMGIHTGEPEQTETGYVGLDVHRAARIAAAGHGRASTRVGVDARAARRRSAAA